MKPKKLTITYYYFQIIVCSLRDSQIFHLTIFSWSYQIFHQLSLVGVINTGLDSEDWRVSERTELDLIRIDTLKLARDTVNELDKHTLESVRTRMKILFIFQKVKTACLFQAIVTAASLIRLFLFEEKRTKWMSPLMRVRVPRGVSLSTTATM